jgi:hypothetical protein
MRLNQMNYPPHPVDYAQYQPHAPVTVLKYIGPYLSERFVTESFWPASSNNANNARPIQSLGELRDFIVHKSGVNARRNLRAWLRRIMTNERSRQCVMQRKLQPKMVDPEGVPRRYDVNEVNYCGYNSVIGFLRHHFPAGNAHHGKIPMPLTGRAEHVKYPPRCAV